MAHELSIRKNGFVEMAYVGDKPWHGLGQELTEGASLEEWQRAAGMDWRIQRSFVRYATGAQDEPDAWKKDDENVVLFRSDSKARLGIVSADFKVVQPHEVLEFFRDLTEAAGYQLCTAGVLKGGRKFWAQADCHMEDAVMGSDVVKGKLLIATACDGSMRTKVKKVAERVVCANTLSIACQEKGDELNVSHRSKFDPARAKAQLGIATEDFRRFMDKCSDLARAKLQMREVEKFLLPMVAGEMMHDAKALEKDVRGNVGFRKIMDLFKHGRGHNLQSSDGTAWGLVNAVTEYVDHHRGNSATTRDIRMDYAWFGEGDKLKSYVFDKAVEAFA